MKLTLRRSLVGCVAAVVALAASAAQAQILNHVRDDAIVIVKLNNLQNISQKLAAFAQKLGLAQLAPPLADPLGAGKQLVRQQLHLVAKEGGDGLDDKGEAALVVFPPVAGEREPRMMVLLPVGDYKVFLANFPEVKKEGELDSFAAPNGEPLFLEQWDKFAALTPWKDLLLEKPQGLKVTGPIAEQFQKHDATIYVNMKAVRQLILPGFQQVKQMIQGMPMPNAAQQPNAAAFQKAIAVQMFDFFEAFLTQSQAVTQSLNLVPSGIAGTFAVQFEANSDLAKHVASLKNTDANLIAGIPQDKYLLFGGATIDGNQMWEMFNGIYGPALKAPTLTEAETKSVNDIMASYKTILSSITGMRMGLLQPPAEADLQSGILRGFTVGNISGDAKAIQEANRKAAASQEAFMKATGNEGINVKMNVTPDGKTIDGLKMDTYKVEFKVDPKAQPNPQVAQIIQFLYGPGMDMVNGIVNDKTMVSLIGLDDAKAKAVVSAVKQDQSPMATAEGVKEATDNLPKNRLGVAYIAADNIFATAMSFAQKLGGIRPVKLPPDLPPMALSVGSEGDTFRIDSYVPTTLVESMVSAGIQLQAQRLGGGKAAPKGAQP
jgi:hypothetical protein